MAAKSNGNPDRVRFTELIDINPRVNLGKLTPDDLVSFIPMSDVTDSGQWVGKQTRPLREVDIGYSVFQEGDVLFAKITPCTENGKGCHAVGLTKGVGFGSTEFHVLRAKPGINPRIVYHISVATEVRAKAAAMMGGSAGQQRVPSDFFKHFWLSRRWAEIQDNFSRLLDAVEEAIEATRLVIKQTLRLKASLQEVLLARGVGHTRFRKTKVGQIPTAWATDTVGNLCEFSSGTGFSHSDWSTIGLPIIRIQNLNGSSDFNYYEGEYDPKWIVEPGELLFAWAGVKGVSFGPCIWPGPRGLLNQHIYRIRPNEGVDGRWLYAILGEVTHRIEAKAHGFKTSLVHVHKADITNQIVAVPPSEEQIRIAGRLEAMERWVASQVDHLTQLEATKNALSQGLLTGRIPLLSKGTQ